MSTSLLFDPARAVLVVVDEQERLMPSIFEVERVVARSRAMIGIADAVGLHVIFTEQYPKGLGPTTQEIRALFGERTPIAKTSFGCYGCEEFADAMATGGYETVLLAGVETHICVFQTAAQCIERGLRVHILTDAVSAGSQSDHAVGLERLRQIGAVTSSTIMATYEYLREAGTPLFRQVLPLLKA